MVALHLKLPLVFMRHRVVLILALEHVKYTIKKIGDNAMCRKKRTFRIFFEIKARTRKQNYIYMLQKMGDGHMI